MPEFASWTSYGHFAATVVSRTRFIFDKETREFLQCVIATSASRKFRMPKGTPLWRAQLHEANLKGWDVKNPYPPRRMKPLLNCPEGRLNPKNIPYLYLATDGMTAMSEVRPWVGVVGTLAEFSTTRRELGLVNCAEKIPYGRPKLSWITGNEPSPEQRERYVWGGLNSSFSEPLTSTETTAHYAPTQVLAETFKSAGFDGVIYNSSVADGLNVALFDLKSAKVVRRSLFVTKKLGYEFKVYPRKAANP
jgi:hypothetical protein